MKYLLILFLALFACKPQDPQPTSAQGNWRFSTASSKASGTFTIAFFDGSPVVDRGQFTLNGKTYQAVRQAIEVGNTVGSFRTVWLVDQTGTTSIAFSFAVISADFTSMSCQTWNYVVDSTPSIPIYETVTITR